MKIKFWGVRGSHTVSGIDFLKYGGNTTCLSVEVEDKIFLIDAGSGIINFDIEESYKYNEFNMLWKIASLIATIFKKFLCYLFLTFYISFMHFFC